MANTKPKTQSTSAPNPVKLPPAVPIGQGKYLDASSPKSKTLKKLLS